MRNILIVIYNKSADIAIRNFYRTAYQSYKKNCEYLELK